MTLLGAKWRLAGAGQNQDHTIQQLPTGQRSDIANPGKFDSCRTNFRKENYSMRNRKPMQRLNNDILWTRLFFLEDFVRLECGTMMYGYSTQKLRNGVSHAQVLVIFMAKKWWNHLNELKPLRFTLRCAIFLCCHQLTILTSQIQVLLSASLMEK